MANDELKQKKEISFVKALIGLIVPVGIMVPLVLIGIDLIFAYLAAIFFLVVYGLVLGYEWDGLSKDMLNSGATMLEAALMIALVGGLIGAWIIGGTIPTMIYYGLKLISPQMFAPLTFLLCVITSMTTGSNWGTVGTVGVALFGVAAGMGFPLPLTVGAIVSGAVMGDKLSPLSDTTLLASASTKTNLFDHVISMLYTTVPLVIICFVLYTILGFKYSPGELDAANISLLVNGISANFNTSVLTLLPLALVLVLAFKRMPPLAVFGIGLAASIIFAVILQPVALKDVFTTVVSGYSSSTGIELIDNLLSRGGINSMLSVMMIAILAGMLSGIMSHMSILETVINRMVGALHSPAALVTLVTLLCSGLAIGACDQYLILTLPGIAFRPSFDKADIHSAVLSRTLEDTGTVMTSIVPWSMTASFIIATYGVPTLSYLPFTFFSLLSPFVCILNAWLGIGLFRTTDKVKYRPLWRRSKNA